MSGANAVSHFPLLNWSRVRVLLALAALAYLALAGFLVWNGRLIYALLWAGLPACVVIITHPRVALYSFIFLFFLPWTVLNTLQVFVYDVGAVLLILAAILDLFLNGDETLRFPRLSLCYAGLFLALLLASLFGYSFAISVRPLMRLILIFLVFLSVHRISKQVPIIVSLRLFFWLTAAHAAIALYSFVASGGTARSFGLLDTNMDDLAAMALPVGLGLTLWADPGKAWRLVAGMVVVFGGLVATQSRAPMLFAIVACLFMMYLSYRRSRQMLTLDNPNDPLSAPSLVQRRLKLSVLIGLLVVLLLVVLRTGLLSSVFGRFERLLTTTPGDTFRLRLVLWGQALTVFNSHPILGIGPGLYRHVADIVPTLRMDPLNYYVRGLSAHNLLLHYLAETGIVGTAALLTLFVRQFVLARVAWVKSTTPRDSSLSAMLLILAGYILFTIFFEAAWMWGGMSMVAAFALALIVRHHSTVTSSSVSSISSS